MKAITLHQPWATLIALGVKTIETRPRPTSYRGRIAIHAGLHRPPLMHLPPLSRERNDRQTWLVIDTITEPAFHGPQPQDRRVPMRATTPTLYYPHEGPHARPWDETAGTSATEQGTAILLPLGAVVGSAVLTHCLPMHDTCADPIPNDLMYVTIDGGGLYRQQVLGDPSLASNVITTDMTDQLPFGDFRLGRWAYLLDLIKPTTSRCPWCWGTGECHPARYCTEFCNDDGSCDVCGGHGSCTGPVPARGQQAVPWEWTHDRLCTTHRHDVRARKE